jgi:hypothetical protein
MLTPVNEFTIRDRIRAMLKTGEIPREDGSRTWAGYGEGAPCAACSKPVSGSELEYEVDLVSGGTLNLHLKCHSLWQLECVPLNRRR